MDKNDKEDAYDDEDWDEDEEYQDEEYQDEEYQDEDDEYDGEDEDEEYDGEDEDELPARLEAPLPTSEDPWWWLPHAVLALSVLVGLLGFFGLFNPWLGSLAAVRNDHAEPIVSPQPASTKPQVKPHAALQVPAKAAASMASAAGTQRFSAKEILIQYKGAKLASAKVTRTREQAVERARMVLTKALKTMTSSSRQQDWAQLVEQFGDVAEPDPERKGSRMPPPPVVKTIKGMKAGDVEGPIETDKGFYIVWRTR